MCSHKDSQERRNYGTSWRHYSQAAAWLRRSSSRIALNPINGVCSITRNSKRETDGFIHRATIISKEGEILASTEANLLTRSTANGIKLIESLTETINQDGSITLDYSVKAVKVNVARESALDETVLYEIKYTPTYYKMDGNICITKAYGMARKKVSYASFQGKKAVTAHQGIAGSDKCHAEALFTTESKTITTGFDQIPYVKSSDSNGMVANGGECTATLYVSGMGEQIIRAELYL